MSSIISFLPTRYFLSVILCLPPQGPLNMKLMYFLTGSVSKRRFWQRLSANNANVETLLVAHCMRLVSQHGIGIAVYDNVKYCLYALERQGIISLPLLQATMIVALYEISNAVYPAAYLTVGHCARLGQAMGLHDRRSLVQMFPVPRQFSRVRLQLKKCL